jgi:F0F1-type ATP synthase membrane subunit b/b'
MEISTGAIIVAIGAIVFFFRDMIIAAIGGSIRKESDKADKKDQTLAQQQDDLNDAANAAKSKADELGNQANNQPDDEDWHKRR